MTVYVNPYGTEGTVIPNFQGVKGVTSATTSSTAIAGDFTVSASTAGVYQLEAPATGKIAILGASSTTTSTEARTWTLVSGNIQTTASTTYTSVTLNGAGQYAQLIGASTARWHSLGASAAVVFA